ncbi:hypothetical protein LUZ63_004460 [Rhynchospora breviuscula]|uniref:GDSL esterase/lipase n=1 Tax=Rhynchospora breviuscula TaxID=2022672 RepID=A0A9Q0I005_9POAL|nr:hypothetical protein LUZ63_004460 [Rhynchospora breviuscula]
MVRRRVIEQSEEVRSKENTVCSFLADHMIFGILFVDEKEEGGNKGAGTNPSFGGKLKKSTPEAEHNINLHGLKLAYAQLIPIPNMASPSSFFGIGIVSILLVLTKARATVPIFVLGDSLADNGNNNDLNVPLLDKSNFAHNGIDFPGRIATGRFSNGFNGVDYIDIVKYNTVSVPKVIGFASIYEIVAFVCKVSRISNWTAALLFNNKLNQMLGGVNFASAGSGIQDYTGPGTINMTTQIKNFQNVAQVLQQTLGQSRAEHIITTSMFIIVTANNDMFEYYFATGAANAASNEQFINNLVDRFIQHLMSLYNYGARNFI